MKEQAAKRLETLKQEFELGQEKMRELTRQESALRETMLRISGAMQVLEELLAAEAAPQASNVEPFTAAAKR
jgi:predicted nuclease with TOPRIM domain